MDHLYSIGFINIRVEIPVALSYCIIPVLITLDPANQGLQEHLNITIGFGIYRQ